MRIVTWTDRNGYKHRSLMRDGDPDDAAESGIPQEPPNLDMLDWEGVKRDLHNALVDAGLYSWQDVQHEQGLQGCIQRALRVRLISLYREADKHG